MVFAWIAISFLLLKFLPWWAIVLGCGMVGFLRPARILLDFQLALVTGTVALGMAFYADGRNFGLISKRMAGLFSLPIPDLVFALIFILFSLTALLSLQSGKALRALMIRFSQ